MMNININNIDNIDAIDNDNNSLQINRYKLDAMLNKKEYFPTPPLAPWTKTVPPALACRLWHEIRSHNRGWRP